MLAKINNLTSENEYLKNEIILFGTFAFLQIDQKLELMQQVNAEKSQQQLEEFEVTKLEMDEKIQALEATKQKMVKEISQLKMILRKPYLHQKYRNANFEFFEHLDLSKFDPKEKIKEPEIKKKHPTLSIKSLIPGSERYNYLGKFSKMKR